MHWFKTFRTVGRKLFGSTPTAAMFAGFVTRLAPEDNLLGEGLAQSS